MRSNNSFYSLEAHLAGVDIVHIETVVTGGLYRFDIIGTNHKLASDTKNKVYTSLRASSLLNLKSDNRKITTSLRSTTIENQHVKPQLCELAVALSCLYCINNNKIEDKILTLGELSITGTIIPSHRLIQGISLALDNNISYIVCTDSDLESVSVQFITYAHEKGIHFIYGTTIKEIYSNIENRVYYNAQHNRQTDTETSLTDHQSEVTDLLNKDVFLQTVCVALCGYHNLLIRSDKFYRLQTLERIINTLAPQIPTSTTVSMSKTHPYTDLDMDRLHEHKVYLYDSLKKPTQISDTEGKLVYFLSCPMCPCGNSQQQCFCTQKSISLYNKKLRAETRAYTLETFVTTSAHKLSPRQYLLVQSHLRFIQNIRRLNMFRYEQLEGEEEDVYLGRIIDKKGLTTLKNISNKLAVSDTDHLLAISKTILFMRNYSDIRDNKTPLMQECHILEAFNLIYKTD